MLFDVTDLVFDMIEMEFVHEDYFNNYYYNIKKLTHKEKVEWLSEIFSSAADLYEELDLELSGKYTDEQFEEIEDNIYDYSIEKIYNKFKREVDNSIENYIIDNQLEFDHKPIIKWFIVDYETYSTLTKSGYTTFTASYNYFVGFTAKEQVQYDYITLQTQE